MSFVRDFFAPTSQTNVPLTVVTALDDRGQPHDGFTDPGPSTPQACPRSSYSQPEPQDENEDELSTPTASPRSSSRSRLYPPSAGEATLSPCSTATNTPLPSRSSSPLPFYYSGTSSCSSDSESEPGSPLLGTPRRSRAWRDGERPRSWLFPFASTSRSRSGSAGGDPPEPWRQRRRWRDVIWGMRSFKRLVRRLIRHPFFPKTPVTIVRPIRSVASLRLLLRHLAMLPPCARRGAPPMYVRRSVRPSASKALRGPYGIALCAPLGTTLAVERGRAAALQLSVSSIMSIAY